MNSPSICGCLQRGLYRIFFMCAVVLIAHLAATTAMPHTANNSSVEKLLIRKLLERYSRFGVIGRPVNDSQTTLMVVYGLAIVQILDLDEELQVLRTICWSRLKWKDSLLQWNPANYSNIRQLRIFPDQLWTPDVRLFNFADERMKEHREARVVVHSNGELLWVPQALFKSTCKVKILYFPFDSQVCTMVFGSWTYDITQLDVDFWTPDGHNSSMPYIDFSDYVRSNEWRTDGEKEATVTDFKLRTEQILSYRTMRIQNFTDNEGNLIIRRYPVLQYRIRIHRNPSFYVFILVIPCFLLSSLTLTVFCLPPESPAKMQLGMSIFVAFFVLMLLLAESTPSAVKSFPLIGYFFCLNMITITLSTFLETLVINLYFRGDRKGPLPAIFRRLIVEGLGRLLKVRQYVPLPDPKKLITQTITTSSPAGKIRRKVHVPELKSNKFQMREQQQQSGDTSQPGNSAGENSRHGGSSNFGGVYASYGGSAGHLNYSSGGNGRIDNNMGGVVDPDDSPIMIHAGSNLERDVREIKRYIRLYVNKQKEVDRKNMISMEWRTLSLVLDRLFFISYILTMAIAIIVALPKDMETIRGDMDSLDNSPAPKS